ncbi:MAG: thioesterase family protein [Dehalococcoidia bacterium]|nr:thioesterase family protein [Dehalococcoidia bacterium]
MAEGTFFFEQDGDVYHPTPHTRGPWDPQSLHGRVIAGLLAHQIEADHGDPAFQAVRLTVDMFRVAPMKPMRVPTRMVRDGNRIRVVDASMVAEDGTEIARGNVVFLRRAEQPEGEIWTSPAWDAPHPETLPEPEPPEGVRDRPWTAMWETRRIQGDFGTVGPKRAWLRETHDLVAGIPQSSLVRLAQTSDFTNPFANSGSTGLNFVNADVTLYLHRDSTSEWTGIEVVAHHSTDGIAVGECVLHDLDGPVGRATVCGVANRRQP